MASDHVDSTLGHAADNLVAWLTPTPDVVSVTSLYLVNAADRATRAPVRCVAYEQRARPMSAASDEAFSGAGHVVEPTAVIRPERTPAMDEPSSVRVISGRLANAANVARGWQRRAGYVMVVLCLAVTALTDDATSSHDRARTERTTSVMAAPPAPRQADPPAPSPPTTPAAATPRSESAAVRSTLSAPARSRATGEDDNAGDSTRSWWRHGSGRGHSSRPGWGGGYDRSSTWGRGGYGWSSGGNYSGYQRYAGYGGYGGYGHRGFSGWGAGW